MQNYVQPGNTIALTAPYTVTSGQGALVLHTFGVACGDTTIATEGEFALVGVFDITKDASVFAQGDLVYWSDTARECQVDDSGGVIIGIATEDAATDATEVRVRLNGAFGI